MKNSRTNIFRVFLLLIPLSLLYTMLMSCQSKTEKKTLEFNALETKINYEVIRVKPWIEVFRKDLKSAKTIADITDKFKHEWVKQYTQVSIEAHTTEGVKLELAPDQNLTPDQKALLSECSPYFPIKIKVDYFPDNTLSSNEEKTHEFNFTVVPEKTAQYSSSKFGSLDHYLSTEALNDIMKSGFTNDELCIIKFTVTENGDIRNAHIFESNTDAAHAQLILEAVNKMPAWEPASFNDGLSISSEMALVVGALNSCVIPTLAENRN